MATTVRSLPTPTDSAKIEQELQHVFDDLERVEWALRDLSEHGLPREYPQEVTYETLGVLAEIYSTLRWRIRDFERVADVIEDGMHAVAGFRDEQATYGRSDD